MAFDVSFIWVKV